MDFMVKKHLLVFVESDKSFLGFIARKVSIYRTQCAYMKLCATWWKLIKNLSKPSNIVTKTYS